MMLLLLLLLRTHGRATWDKQDRKIGHLCCCCCCCFPRPETGLAVSWSFSSVCPAARTSSWSCTTWRTGWRAKEASGRRMLANRGSAS
uniref:Secreted peptide n=1 Tax=Anopheles braziliensis TaxID=58242 RepID=A0A2M3ZLK5_9DIPT